MHPFHFIRERRQCTVERTPEFGWLSFDHYILDKWDTVSTKTESEQREDLVNSWLALGWQGRLVYHDKRLAARKSGFQSFSVPNGIPRHLQTSQQRFEISTVTTRIMWVRTWFGNTDASRDEADAAYAKLCKHVDDDESEFLDGNWAFEDDEEFMDTIGAPTVTGVTPQYVKSLLKRYPDALERAGGPTESEREFITAEGGQVGQRLLMMVADKIACETGAVLLLGIDEYGEMMPQRLRIRADDVIIHTGNWEDGQAIEECFHEGQKGELHYYEGEDAWVSG